MDLRKWRRLGYRYSLERGCANLAFVPRHRGACNEDIEKMTQFLADKQKLVVITGAGNYNYNHSYVTRKTDF